MKKLLLLSFLLISALPLLCQQEQSRQETKKTQVYIVSGERHGVSFFPSISLPHVEYSASDTLSFRKYHSLDVIYFWLEKWAREYPDLIDLYEVGKSYEGRPIMQITLTNKKTGKDTDKPASFFEGNRHSGEITSAECILWMIQYLLGNYGKDPAISHLIDTKTFYMKPVNNPDGQNLYLHTAQSNRSTVRPYDNDNDGLLDEDSPDDLDSNGVILTMRWKDEKKGNLIPDPRDTTGRIMKRVAEGKGIYLSASEGIFADVYLENRISRQIVMEESKFKSGLYGISQGAGVRVISGNKTGYAYSDEMTEEKLLRAAEVASCVARNTTAVSPVNISEAARPSFVTVLQPLGDIADEKRIEIIKRADQAARDYDPRIKMAMVDYYDEVRSRVIANSEGIYLSAELPLLFFIVQAMSDNGSARHMARERLSNHSGFEMFENVTPETVARNAAREAIAMLDAEEAPAGIMDVVMQNGWGGVLVHEAVGHPLEADNIAKGIGAFTGKMGQKVANECFTMIDDGSIPNFRGTINFDDEGTEVKRNILIENGILKGFMTDILSSKQLNMIRTGNGRRESFRYIPIPRMTNTFIAQGKDNPEDILSATKKGIYVQSLSGGSVNPVTGVFNFTCRESYLIENGKKTKPVKGATLIGSCMDVISNIDAVGSDLAFGPGICGKGQSAEVTAGQPTVRIRGINVGGSRAQI